MSEKWTPKYKVGDLVRLKPNLEHGVFYKSKGDPSTGMPFVETMRRHVGETLKVESVCPTVYAYTLDKCGGLITEGMLEPVYDDNWKIVIMPDCDMTEARLYENGELTKVVHTKKHPDDKYDKFEASKVLIERLFDKEPPKGCKTKPYNGKVVCIENRGNQDMYTIGKIYEFHDGKLTDDKGRKFPFMKVQSFDDWMTHTYSKFIEVVD